jgi:hypothetical protein
MHMWHHVTNHLIISNDKDSNSENRIKLCVRDRCLLHRRVCRLRLSANRWRVVVGFDRQRHFCHQLLEYYFLLVRLAGRACVIGYCKGDRLVLDCFVSVGSPLQSDQAFRKRSR